MTMPFNRVWPRGGAPHPAQIQTVVPADPHAPLAPLPDIEDERLYRKQRLAAGFRIFARMGFVLGDAGHITARDPELTDCFWVNPAGMHFSRISVSELMLVDYQGQIVQPPKTYPAQLNPAAFAIHSELHRARPDIVTAAHAHSVHGMAWSTLGRLLDPITQDIAAFFEDHALFTDFSGLVLQTSEGARIAQALGSSQAVILENHGLLTVGRSVESAVWRFIAFDSACQVQLLAEAAGRPHAMPPEVARLTASQLGTERAGLDAFLPYWAVVADEEPDLFD
jgi:ribulose-5-phosphate 4-epimerase/fuculose-1-phosphate aldolase